MKIIKTPNYINMKSAYTDLNVHPGFRPTKNDNTPSKDIFEDDNDSKDAIKKRWKDKKKKNKDGLIYQLGIPVPVASDPKP